MMGMCAWMGAVSRVRVQIDMHGQWNLEPQKRPHSSVPSYLCLSFDDAQCVRLPVFLLQDSRNIYLFVDVFTVFIFLVRFNYVRCASCMARDFMLITPADRPGLTSVPHMIRSRPGVNDVP